MEGRIAALLLAFAFVATAATGQAHEEGGQHGFEHKFPVMLGETGSADTVAVYDDATGVLTIARQLEQSDPEFKYVPIRRFGVVDGNRIHAADLNGDGLQDLILPSFSANRVFVLWGATLDRSEIPVEEILTGPGPEAVAPALLDRLGASDVLVANTAQAGMTVRGWDFVSKEPVTEQAAFPKGFAAEGIFGFDTATSSRGAPDPALGILRKDAAAEFVVLKIVQRLPDPEYGPDNTIASLVASAPHTRLISGHPAGANEAGWFLGYAPGAPVIEFFPSNPGSSVVADLGAPVAQVSFLPEVNDEVLVLFETGSLALYDFSADTGLSLAQAFSTPAGMTFAGAVGGDGTLIALLADGFGQLAQYQVFEKGSDDYELVNQGDWPVLPAMEAGVTVILYTSDPFSIPAPFPFETFVAGDWAREASYSLGTVSFVTETFGGTAQGLGDPVAQALAASGDPGPTGTAVGNQWEPSSSLFYLAPAAAADGLAAVAIQPPPGSYPNTVTVSFQAGEDVAVMYRVNNGPWQSGFGPVHITQNATIEYYGEHISGALSSIQTAVYQINQWLGADFDGDGVPDIIEEMAGLNPFDPDSSGSGWDDFNWILYGDLDNPEEAPSHIALPFDRFHVELVWDDADSIAAPSLNQKLSIANALNQPLGSAEATSNPGSAKYENIVLKRGTTEDSVFAKFWFPAFYLLEGERTGEPAGPAMVSFGGIPFTTPPSIPVDPTADDPLEAWRQAALDAVEAHENTVHEFTIGPSSTLAALVFEFWYGERLVDLGRISSFDDRPRLAETPRSVRAGTPEPEDIKAIQTPQGGELLAHDLSHVVQQVNSAVLTGEGLEPLRETAESFYAQAIDATRAGTPLDPPINAMRQLLAGLAPPGYVLPHDPSTVAVLRDQVLGSIIPREYLVLEGILSRIGDDLLLDSGGETYRLLDARGRPYRLEGAGLNVNGSLAVVTGTLVSGSNRVTEKMELIVERLQRLDIPADPDTDITGNGLPDSWLWAFLGRIDVGFWDDINGNGFSLAEEYLAGTDPRDLFSVPPGAPAITRNLRLEMDESGVPVVKWDGSFAAEYELMESFDLGNWVPHPGAVERQGDREHSVDVELDDERGFYRLHIRLPLP